MDQDIFERIEQPNYSAMVNLASGYKQFVKAIQKMDDCELLLKLASISPDTCRAISTRLDQVCARPIDEEHENPWDAALATYLWVLSKTDAPLATTGAERLRSCRNCWWSQRLAEEIRESIGHACPSTLDKDAASAFCPKAHISSV